MKILIGTDILLYYLQKNELMDGMTMMFKWIDRIDADKYVDISSIAILTNFASLESFVELKNYEVLRNLKPKADRIERLDESLNNKFGVQGVQYKPLLAQLNWLFYEDVDLLITENLMSHNVAKVLGIDDKVFTIEEFIEKCSLEYCYLDETKGVAISKVRFGTLDYNDAFLDTFKEEYKPYYQVWFKKKSNDFVYIAKDQEGALRGLLKLKVEEPTEDFGDIHPKFLPKKRLKISSLKADYSSQRLGERFMRIIFETAIKEEVEEIYITIVVRGVNRLRLVNMVKQWGFATYGIKGEKEQVFVRDFTKKVTDEPKTCFPFHSPQNGAFIIPIYRSYATQLLPPFGLDLNDNDVESNKRAIKKVVILHHDDNRIKEGSVLLFFQKSEASGCRHLIGVGVAENVYRNFPSEYRFKNRCRKRSLLTEESLHDCWVRADEKPIVVEFLYAYYFEELITTALLESIGININEMHSQTPLYLEKEQFCAIIKNTDYAKTIVVN